jgi:hypothetical protein
LLSRTWIGLGRSRIDARYRHAERHNAWAFFRCPDPPQRRPRPGRLNRAVRPLSQGARSRLGLKVVFAAADLVADHPEDGEDRADHDDDDADRPDNGDLGDEADNEENDTENYHVGS